MTNDESAPSDNSKYCGGEYINEVNKVRIDHYDCLGRKIKTVYYRIEDNYAVYKAENASVEAFLADEKCIRDVQLINLQPLAHLRDRLTYVINIVTPCHGQSQPGSEHHGQSQSDSDVRKEFYERCLARAIRTALDGNSDAAVALLNKTLSMALEELARPARIIQLITASITGFGLFFLLVCSPFWLGLTANSGQQAIDAIDSPAKVIWLYDLIIQPPLLIALAFGVLGALFSVIWSIRSRIMTPDIHMAHRLTNIIDAAGRVVIGGIAGGMIYLLLSSEVFPKISISDTEVSGEKMTVAVVAVLGFIAGFLERLVPDLLSSSSDPSSAEKPR
jgi:hypothetical protein